MNLFRIITIYLIKNDNELKTKGSIYEVYQKVYPIVSSNQIKI